MNNLNINNLKLTSPFIDDLDSEKINPQLENPDHIKNIFREIDRYFKNLDSRMIGFVEKKKNSRYSYPCSIKPPSIQVPLIEFHELKNFVDGSLESCKKIDRFMHYLKTHNETYSSECDSISILSTYAQQYVGHRFLVEDHSKYSQLYWIVMAAFSGGMGVGFLTDDLIESKVAGTMAIAVSISCFITFLFIRNISHKEAQKRKIDSAHDYNAFTNALYPV